MKFDFEMPVSFFEKANAPDGQQRRIGGIVSLETKDRQGEVVLQRGLNFQDFLKNGWLNDNHSKDTDGVVGYPELVKFFKKGAVLPDGSKAPASGHWVEGYMLDNYDRANRIWNLARSLQKTNRKLGFSVEGKIQRRTGPGYKTIAQALVRNVAITNCPVHTGARMDILAKSLQVAEQTVMDPMEKALAMGTAVGNTTPTGPQTGEGAGQVITGESLESDLQPRLPFNEKKKKKEDEVEKGLTDAEAFAWFQTRLPNATPAQIGRLIQLSRRLKSDRIG